MLTSMQKSLTISRESVRETLFALLRLGLIYESYQKALSFIPMILIVSFIFSFFSVTKLTRRNYNKDLNSV